METEWWLNHPLDQFEIVVLYPSSSYTGLPVSFSVVSNLTVILLCNTLLIRLLFAFCYEYANFNALELFLLQVYYLVKSIIKSNTSLRRYQYFTALLFLFVFVLVSNMVGLIPYSFTSTSSFVITFFLAASYFIATNMIGISVSKWETLDILLPSGVPLLIIPFLIIIEIVSYIAKVLSLSIRLFANMMSGHALLKILIGFSWGLLQTRPLFVVLGILPWILVTVILFLEALIAFLQAYVFTILATIYINDVLVSH